MVYITREKKNIATSLIQDFRFCGFLEEVRSCRFTEVTMHLASSCSGGERSWPRKHMASAHWSEVPLGCSMFERWGWCCLRATSQKGAESCGRSAGCLSRKGRDPAPLECRGQWVQAPVPMNPQGPHPGALPKGPTGSGLLWNPVLGIIVYMGERWP